LKTATEAQMKKMQQETVSGHEDILGLHSTDINGLAKGMMDQVTQGAQEIGASAFAHEGADAVSLSTIFKLTAAEADGPKSERGSSPCTTAETPKKPKAPPDSSKKKKVKEFEVERVQTAQNTAWNIDILALRETASRVLARVTATVAASEARSDKDTFKHSLNLIASRKVALNPVFNVDNLDAASAKAKLDEKVKVWKAGVEKSPITNFGQLMVFDALNQLGPQMIATIQNKDSMLTVLKRSNRCLHSGPKGLGIEAGHRRQEAEASWETQCRQKRQRRQEGKNGILFRLWPHSV
jgi:hypothetical protein